MRIVISYMAMFFIGVLVGILLFAKFHEDKVVVKEVKVKETVYVKKPVTMKDYEECYKSRLMIQATGEENGVVRVRAYDMCKETEAEIKVATPRWETWLAAGIGFVIGIVIFTTIL